MGLDADQSRAMRSAIVFTEGESDDGFEYEYSISTSREGNLVWTTTLNDATLVTFTVGSSLGTIWIQPSVEETWVGQRAIVARISFFKSWTKTSWRALGIATYLLGQLPEGAGYPSKKARKHFRTYLRTQSAMYHGADRGIVELPPTDYLA